MRIGIVCRFGEVVFNGYQTTTQFHDGALVTAIPHPVDPHYSVIAHRLGYGDDLSRYCFEHEVAHMLVEQHHYSRPSRTLWGLAHDSELDPLDAVYEECAAQQFQGYMRANTEPIVAGHGWHDLKAWALANLGPINGG